MKQMIYRRLGGAGTGTGGYGVTACADSITALQRSEARKHTRVPALRDENIKHRASFYWQYRLDADTLSVSCGYYDPHDPRGSAIVQTAMTETADERARYLQRLPAASGYFDAIKAEYTDVCAFEIENGDMMLPLEDYFAAATAEHADALRIIREELGSEENVREMFCALLDAASSNPRMVVVFMDAPDLVCVGERGRRLAESLLFCLPECVASSLGFVSPATDDSENIAFGLRFALRDGFRFANAQSQAYVFDLAAGSIVKPRTAESGAEEYVRELTRLVMQGDASALERIAQLRGEMNDHSLFRQKEKLKGKSAPSIPAEMNLRYALLTRPDRLEHDEMRSMLNWRHAMAEECLARPDGDRAELAFWSRVDDWTLNRCLPKLWRSQSDWRKGDGVNDPDAVKCIFEDSGRLHLAGRAEMLGYRAFVADRLESDALYSLDPGRLNAKLVEYFSHCASSSEPQKQLYFEPVERWLRTVWLNGENPPHSREVFAALEKLCAANALEADKLKIYVNGYSKLIFLDCKTLYVASESRFHELVVQAVVQRNPAGLDSAMNADLGNKNPYAENGRPMWLWYERILEQLPALKNKYLAMNHENLKNALAHKSADDVPALVEELQDSGRGLIDCARRLDASLDVRKMIEERIVALSKTAGIGNYYPDRVELAEKIAGLLEKYGQPGGLKMHRALADVCEMDPGDLTMNDFVRFAEIISMRPDVVSRARELLEQKLCRAWTDPANVPLKSALVGAYMLSLENWNGLQINPARAAAWLDRLDIRERKLVACCKGLADADATEGLGCLADAMLSYLNTPEKKRTGETIGYPRPPRVQVRRRAPLENLPLAVPIAGMAAFAGGLAASALGLLHCIGLM